MALPKHTARRSGRIFQYHIPDHWIIRSQEDQEDYGVDFEIQIAEKDTDAVTPHIFKLQLKGIGTDRTESDKATFAMEIGKLKQYEILEIPIFLIVVYTQTNEIFWVNLQNNKKIQTAIDEKIKDVQSNKEEWNKTITEIENKIRKNNPNVDTQTIAKNRAINSLSVSIELPYKFKLADNIIDTKELEDKFHEIYHYLWKIKPRKFKDFSNQTLNQIENKNATELFWVKIEQLYRQLDKINAILANKDESNNLIDDLIDDLKQEVENFMGILNIYSSNDFEKDKQAIQELMNDIEFLDENINENIQYIILEHVTLSSSNSELIQYLSERQI